MDTKTITLQAEEWEAIANALQTAQDEGPEGAGWKSARLSSAEASLIRAMEEAAPERRSRSGWHD